MSFKSFGNSKAHDHVNKSIPMDPPLTHFNLIRILTQYFSHNNFNITDLSQTSSPFRFSGCNMERGSFIFISIPFVPPIRFSLIYYLEKISNHRYETTRPRVGERNCRYPACAVRHIVASVVTKHVKDYARFSNRAME